MANVKDPLYFDLNKNVSEPKNNDVFKFDIAPIFSIPLYRAPLNYKLSEKDKNDLNKIIETEDMHDRMFNLQSKDVFVFNSMFPKLKEEILIHINNYIKNVHDPDADFKCKITQSWLNFYSQHRPSLHEHDHPNSFLSGVYYLKTKQEDLIIFRDHKCIEKYGFQFEVKQSTNFNQQNVVVTVEEGILLLWPSTVKHYVPQMNEIGSSHKIDRISLSFNTFLTGHLGLPDNLTFLEM